MGGGAFNRMKISVRMKSKTLISRSSHIIRRSCALQQGYREYWILLFSRIFYAKIYIVLLVVHVPIVEYSMTAGISD